MASPPPSAAASPSPTTDHPPLTAPSSAPPLPPPRKFPAPCWTQDETLALIAAYRDKWYSLRRRNLRTADWEAVANDVTRRCPNQSPPKTSAQCRHKMEKLRKRYRTEKQRAVSLPLSHQGRFFSPSSWVFFDLMESMETGTDPHNHNHNPNPNLNQNPIPNPPIAQIHPNGVGVFVKAVSHGDNKPDLKGKDELGKYFDEILMGMGTAGAVGGGGPIKIRVKNHHHLRRFEDSNHGEDDYYGGNDGGGSDFMKSGIRNPNSNSNSGPPPPGFKRMFPSQDYEERFDSTSGKRVSNGELKRNGRDNSVAEMVASIKMLGEGLVRMEKMKMEMMREIERMRMEMEMKRSEMILESQQLIVNAFVEGLKKNKKLKVMEVE